MNKLAMLEQLDNLIEENERARIRLVTIQHAIERDMSVVWEFTEDYSVTIDPEHYSTIVLNMKKGDRIETLRWFFQVYKETIEVNIPKSVAKRTIAEPTIDLETEYERLR